MLSFGRRIGRFLMSTEKEGLTRLTEIENVK
jgi:hypothetical protein